MSHSSSSRQASLQVSPRQLREAVLSSFCDPVPPALMTLLQLSASQWQGLLPWLDTSGLALYLYDRLSQLNLLDWLPAEITATLQTNLSDNTARMQSMLAESIQIQTQFQRSDLPYVVLKGFSLIPLSVPHLQLRSQLDLDFLVAAKAIEPATRILQDFGFQLHAVSGRSWEFKTPHTHSGSLKDLYRASPARSVELHIEAPPGVSGARVEDREWRHIGAFNMPVQSPVTLFLGQAVHLYKHVSTGFFRISHLLELHRHIVALRNNADFWLQVEQAVADDNALTLPLGVTTLLITQVMGNFAPSTLVRYSESLGASIRMWTERIGPRCVYADWPGTKLHLLLQREIAMQGTKRQTSLRRALLPRSLPPPIHHVPPDASLYARISCAIRRTRYLIFRLRYHVVTGLHFSYELARWNRQVAQLRPAQSVTRMQQHPDLQAADISETNNRMTIL